MRGGGEGQDDEAGADRGDRRDLLCADALVQEARSDDEQEDEAHGEDGLHQGERRDEERGGLESPSGGHEQRAHQPSPLEGETREQRGPQGARGRRLAGLEGLNRDTPVVERRREHRADHSHGHEAHR
ncbi:MAG: hypothetical protein M3Q43_10980 [Actinomycetota bacterium]|nr:hypothetical protein [Thermoleophilaceae bacterium]MDQ3241880.1 hypothetical protein [Actinomycetota bacterium]